MQREAEDGERERERERERDEREQLLSERSAEGQFVETTRP